MPLETHSPSFGVVCELCQWEIWSFGPSLASYLLILMDMEINCDPWTFLEAT